MMENKIALVNKKTKRVENVILVESFDDTSNWSTDLLDAIFVNENQIVYLNGQYDGQNFIQPTNDYLIQIGLLTLPTQESE